MHLISMAKASSLHNTVHALIERLGYSFGKPWHGRDTSAVVVPLILTKPAGKREYVLLEEVKDKVQFTDSGGISKVIVKAGDVDEPIFIRLGIIFKGLGTQSRAVESSKVLFPQNGKDSLVDVRCVHASHHIMAGARFAVSESTPVNIEARLLTHDQGSVWASVHQFAMGIEGPARDTFASVGRNGRIPMPDNLVGHLTSDEYTSTMDKYIREIPNFEDQVGIVVIDSEGVVGIELFDHPKSWKVASEAVIKKYGETFTKSKSSFKPQINDERVEQIIVEFLMHMEESGMEEETKDGTYSVNAAGVRGEYTILNNHVIHFIALRAAVDDKSGKGRRRNAVVMSWDVD